ncbi:MAG: hypothetical protein JWM11_1975 [Planctomycetaceae bacterium]|nr:hypothetical protein [Planctomycetaceae bacterium]
MSDYLRIARAYLSGTAAAVWCFMFLCLLTFDIAEAVSAFDGEVALNQGGILGGVLSRKSYLAMFAYFNAGLLGVLLRDNIAQPAASVLPQYRQKHLVVTALIALFFLAIPMFSMEFVGTSTIAPTSVAVIFLTCLSAGLWTLHHPALGVLAFPFLVFVLSRSASSAELAAFLAGRNLAASAALVIMSLLALWALAWRLLALKEDMLEYSIARVWGDILRGRGQQTKTFADYFANCIAASPADRRVTQQNLYPQNGPFSNLKQVDNLAGYCERSLWQRLQLWRLGSAPTRTSVAVGWLIVLSLIIIGIQIIAVRLAGAELFPARDSVVIFSVQVMMNPVNIWLLWITRLHRLGYESLRPRTRQEFVRELGLTLLWDMIQCWLGGILCLGIAAAIWAPELLEVKNMILFMSATAAGQLCTYGMLGIWLIKRRGTVTNVLCALCPFMAMAMWFPAMLSCRTRGELNLAIGSVLVVTATSVATIAFAYRRWCRADLD